MPDNPTSAPLGRCRSCVYFVPEVSSSAGRGSCEKWRTGYGLNGDDLPADMALVEDDEGWAMNLGPDFGCVLWEATKDVQS